MAEKIFDGYMTDGTHKIAFSVGATSKKDAYNQMKESYPKRRIYVTGWHTGRRVRK